ncbi:MAG: NAD(P)-dependent oxidoreductase [Bacteroidetes bacterium]|nr:NAD(P)-dependent oxidoreductase [Bacteroidota bacterium]MDA0903098.1 NAD(P)-dependent oxidoreductase [Bacteroidota bacterium]MDA1242345.1 NAD(P)-dependent oxidoreductase [Bacteroidota bacterium]
MKIGVVREGKVPPDQRVPLTPAQCAELKRLYPEVELVVEASEVRRISDDEYRAEGIDVVDTLVGANCDVLLGVKEVPLDELIPDTTYLFFSHTYKLQPYNAKLLKTIVDKRIRLIDYELIKRTSGKRVIGFGKWAGIVGAYNALRAWGLRERALDLPRAIECRDMKEMVEHGKGVDLPSRMKIVLTGGGRVGMGAHELLTNLGLREVHKEAFLKEPFEEAVFTRLDVEDYNVRRDGKPFAMKDFIDDPTDFKSSFLPYARVADLYIAGHYWAEGSPFIFTREDMRDPAWKVCVVADVSCDIDGPVACTIRPSTISDPLYGYNPREERECAFDDPSGLTVMAVDNLPCELPRDASHGFGKEMLAHVIPLLVGGDRDNMLTNATETTLDGALAPKYRYLQDYIDRA